MSAIGDERRRWLRVSEFDSGDLDFAVPEPARAGFWEACVGKYVNLLEVADEVAFCIVTSTRRDAALLRGRFLRKGTDCSAVQTAEAILPCIRWLKTYSYRTDLLVIFSASQSCLAA